MRGLINNTERQIYEDFRKNISPFCQVFKDCIEKAKSSNMNKAHEAR